MTSLVVRTGKLTDKEIMKIIEQLFSWFPEGSVQVSLPARANLSIDHSTDFSKIITSSESRNIVSFDFSLPANIAEVIAFHRGIVNSEKWAERPNRGGFNPSLPSGAFDELALLEPHNNPTPRAPLTAEWVIQIGDYLNQYAANVDAANDEESKKLSKVVSRQTDDLRKLHLEMTQGLAKAQADSQNAFAKKEAELEAGFSKRLAQLDEQEADLEKRRKELNDREPQHERRRLREHLTQRLQQTIVEPPWQTGKRERFSHYLYLVAGIAFVFVSVVMAAYADYTTGASAAFWTISIKSLAAGIAGAAFTWAGLAGLRASAIATREYERVVQRYAFDMDRASWVVETILHMNSVEKSTVPDEWLQSVCRDLFVNPDKHVEENKSLEAFAALFDATAKARIGSSGVEFEIDKRGARKLAAE